MRPVERKWDWWVLTNQYRLRTYFQLRCCRKLRHTYMCSFKTLRERASLTRCSRQVLDRETTSRQILLFCKDGGRYERARVLWTHIVSTMWTVHFYSTSGNYCTIGTVRSHGSSTQEKETWGRAWIPIPSQPADRSHCTVTTRYTRRYRRRGEGQEA